jgi:alpha-1,3-rhamnosyl/mannosyltransferase
MRIWVLDARTATDHFPGIGRYVANLAQAVSRILDNEERLLVLCSSVSHSHQGLQALAEKQSLVVNVPVSPFSLRQQWVVPRLLRRLEATAYHSSYYLMPYLPGVPTVLTVYDLIPILFPEYSTARARLLFRCTLALALRTASQVIVVSQATGRDLTASYRLSREKLSIVPLAADPCFRCQPPSEVERVRRRYALPAEYLLYLGSNKPHKNLVRLIDAFSRLAPHISRVVLVIAGAWDVRYPESCQRAEALDLDGSVRFLGPVPDGDLGALYGGATAFVFPSLYEGFGLPVLEAMACGSPVACSDVSSLPEVTGDAALCFDPTDVEAIAGALHQILTDSRLRADLRSRGLDRAARFSWERTARETLDLYRSV